MNKTGNKTGFITLAHNGVDSEATWTIYNYADQANARAIALGDDYRYVQVYELGRKLR